MFFLIKVLTGGIGWWIAKNVFRIKKSDLPSPAEMEELDQKYQRIYIWVEVASVLMLIAGIFIWGSIISWGRELNMENYNDAAFIFSGSFIEPYVAGFFLNSIFVLPMWLLVSFAVNQRADRQVRFLSYVQFRHGFRSFVPLIIFNIFLLFPGIYLTQDSIKNFWVFDDEEFYHLNESERFRYAKIDSMVYSPTYFDFKGEEKSEDAPFYTAFIDGERVLEFRDLEFEEEEEKAELARYIANKSKIPLPERKK